jgi:hypothetical protein
MRIDFQKETFAWSSRISSDVRRMIGMIDSFESEIRDIADPDFQDMVNGLCECAECYPSKFADCSLRKMLMIIVEEDPKCLSEQNLTKPGILNTKVGSLSNDSSVYLACKKLAELNEMSIDSFAGKKVLFLIKKCSKRACCPQFPRAKKLTHNQQKRRFETELILKNRENDPLSLHDL